jgi:FlaA1/EpsC-like NDP-sugar epimerase
MQEQTGAAPSWRERLIAMPRYPKRVLLMTSDLTILCFSLWAGFALRLSEIYTPPTWQFALLLAAAPAIGVATFHYMGLYRLVTRYIGSQGATRILLAVGVAVMLWSLVVVMSGVKGILPRSAIIIYALLSATLIWASRQVAGFILRGVPYATPARFDVRRRNVLIYGAGTTGVQLVQALRQSRDYHPVGFVDENRTLWGQMVTGLKVYRPLKIGKIVERERVDEIILAIPETSRRRRRTILKRLEVYGAKVKTLPAIADIATGRVEVSDVREITGDDLLGRDAVPPDPVLLERNIRGTSVLVTGAGGSIGSELTRQILKHGPRRLVLFDVSEAALYQIEEELKKTTLEGAPRPARPPSPIVAVLGSVLDEALVRATLKLNEVETVFHAAAYKHVPMVELNPIVGLKNNTLGTRIVAEAARDHGVERFVLVSTDKAVRPTNIMGASKRLAELVLQSLAAEPQTRTVFTMVRFGNVLDSSGSVVKLFRRQIQEGGPVTVTHPDVERYFMSIPEAAELVIQAGAMGTGGEVFVLDMGEPVKIDDLARSMIRLMGLEVKDETSPKGDIAIRYTGLRHGEKLAEELLIGENTTSTLHSRIKRCWEPAMSAAELERELVSLQSAMALGDIEAIHAVLRRTVEGYTPETRHLPVQAAGIADTGDASRHTLH